MDIMFKQYFETGDKVEYTVPGQFSIIGTITDIDRYYADYDRITIDCEGLLMDDISLVVLEYYCTKINTH